MRHQTAHKYRFYPTESQKEDLAKVFGCVRFVYNRFLHLKTKEWNDNKKSISYNKCSKMLTELKQGECKFLSEVSCVPVQTSLINLDSAFSGFFKGLTKYPKFKKKHHRQSATYFCNSFSFKDGSIKLAKQKEPLNIVWSRPIPDGCRVTQITVSKDSIDRYYVSLAFEKEIDTLPELDNAIGIDLGIKSILTTDTGEIVENPRFIKSKQRRLKIRERRFFRKKKGGKNREKARLRRAKVEAKIKDARTDFIHKLTTKIVRENQTICVESLNVAEMMKNKLYSDQIADVAWGTILRQLEYKCLWYGRTLKKVDQYFPSSKMCSNCQHVKDDLKLSDRVWTCPSCGSKHDRDRNAAINILQNATLCTVGHTETYA